jgi:adenylate kinase
VRVVLLGLPGAGKGTQAALLAADTGVPHIATGNIFRAAMAAGTPLGQRVKAVVDSGALVPDELTVAVVRERLAQADCERGFVLDGFPRTVAQAEALDGLLAEGGRALDRAIYLDVPLERVVARLAGRRTCLACGATYHVEADPPAPDGTCRRCGGRVVQRADDREEAQRRRVEAYRRETEPLLPYYAGQGKLVRVDGEGTVEEVRQRVRTAALGGGAG